MEIVLDIAATHPQGADGCTPSLRQTLKSRFVNTNTLTNLTEKQLGFFRKVLKAASKVLAEVVSEIWTECEAAINLIEQSELAQSELNQQQWRGTPLPSIQPTIESFWQSRHHQYQRHAQHQEIPKQAETKQRNTTDSDKEGKRQALHTRHRRSNAA